MNDILFTTWGGQIVDNRGKDPQAYEPVTHVNLPETFGQDEKLKALMGWNGIIIRAADVDIIDLCRAYLEAVREHSKTCNKCNYCTTGYNELLDVFQDISKGEARDEDLEFLQSAAEAIREAGKCSIGKSGPLPLLQALKHFADDFSKAGRGERSVTAGKYYSKLTAPCMEACPIHLDIPKYVELIKDAKFAESLDVIRQRLPLPGVVGRVCFRPCEKNCRRANVDEPIAIKSLKRFVADHELSLDKEAEYPVEPSGKTGQVAIVGAGPGGITCAYYLARMGHRVTLYESLGEPGGMSAVGIPDYRLPRPILRGEVERIQKMGPTIHYRQTVGKDVKLPQLESDSDAVFVSIGAQDTTSLGIDGEKEGYNGFIPGLQYLREINEGRDPYPEGKMVVVIGGGNVAIDCARSSFRAGKQEVYVIYRRTRNEMPADNEEIRDAEAEGVRFHFLATPVAVLAQDGKVVGLRCIRMSLGEPDESGRPRPVPVEGSEFALQCDTVVPAVGQRVDLSLLEGVEGVQASRWNTIVVDPATKQSSRPKIFSAGDCETGPDALITACAGGRRAAYGIDRFVKGLRLEHDDEHSFDALFKSARVYDPLEKISKVESRDRKQMPKLPQETRRSTFEEVELGFSNAEAVAEAERCLRCYCVATVAV
jgi:formate dehydrogenase beta subunit